MSNTDDKAEEPNEIWKCSICDTIGVDDSKSIIECTNCEMQFHFYCTQLPADQILALTKSNRVYTCSKCIQTKFSKHLYQLPEINDAIERQKILVVFKSNGDASAAAAAVDASQANRRVSLDSVELVDDTTAEKTGKMPAKAVKPKSNAPKINDKKKPKTTKEDPKTIPPQNDGKKQSKIKTKVCKHYKGKGCKHGDDCDFLHPTVCSRFKANGFGNGGCHKKCKSFHPHICETSWDKRECYIRNCLCHHLDGTKFIVNDNEIYQTSGTYDGNNPPPPRSNIPQKNRDREERGRRNVPMENDINQLNYCSSHYKQPSNCCHSSNYSHSNRCCQPNTHNWGPNSSHSHHDCMESRGYSHHGNNVFPVSDNHMLYHLPRNCVMNQTPQSCCYTPMSRHMERNEPMCENRQAHCSHDYGYRSSFLGERDPHNYRR